MELRHGGLKTRWNIGTVDERCGGTKTRWKIDTPFNVGVALTVFMTARHFRRIGAFYKN